MQQHAHWEHPLLVCRRLVGAELALAGQVGAQIRPEGGTPAGQDVSSAPAALMPALVRAALARAHATLSAAARALGPIWSGPSCRQQPSLSNRRPI
eukprot:1460797-Prymnesium_polylepis.3